MDRRTPRGAGILHPRRRLEAQPRRCLQRERGREILFGEAGVEMADEDAVDIFGLDPGIGERRVDDLQHQGLDVLALMLAEGRMGPADDAACHDMSPSEARPELKSRRSGWER